MIAPILPVGFWGVPGKTGGKTHYKIGENSLLCGAKTPKGEFQFCGTSYNLGAECKHCARYLSNYKFWADCTNAKP